MAHTERRHIEMEPIFHLISKLCENVVLEHSFTAIHHNFKRHISGKH